MTAAESTSTSAFILGQMEEGLRNLQAIPTSIYNIEAAAGRVFSSGNVLRPLKSPGAVEWFHGRALALDLWKQNAYRLQDLRAAARDRL